MSQTSVRATDLKAIAGMLMDSRFVSHKRSVTNNSKQVIEYTITAIDLTTSVTLNGVLFEVNNPPVAQTKEQLKDALVAAINGGSEPVKAASSATDKFKVTSNTSGLAFTSASLVNMTEATIVPNETNVPFGVYVVRDVEAETANSVENIVRLPNITGDISNAALRGGIAIHEHKEPLTATTNNGHEPNSALNLLEAGGAWVPLDSGEAPVPGADVFVRHTASGSDTQLGTFRTDTDGGNATKLPNARFATRANNGLAGVELISPIN
jgi:hypothetical protein